MYLVFVGIQCTEDTHELDGFLSQRTVLSFATDDGLQDFEQLRIF